MSFHLNILGHVADKRNTKHHGKMDALINGFYDVKTDNHAGKTLCGVGMTPEGIENNPVMYELVMELPVVIISFFGIHKKRRSK